MAISLSCSNSGPSLTSDLFASSSSRLSSSLRFPVGLGSKSTLFGPPSRRRVLPLVVEAKKQTYTSFDDMVAKSEKPLLVDFYATWCGPCQLMVPVLEEVNDAIGDKVQVVKVDTEKNPSIADAYNIAALPTFILFKDAKVCDRFEGAMSAAQLIQRVEHALQINH